MQFPAELIDHPDEATLAIQQTSKIDPNLNNVPEIIAAARHSAPVREILAGVLTPRHPSQLYEAFLEGILLFTLLIFIRFEVQKTGRRDDRMFLPSLILSCASSESFLESRCTVTGPFTRGQFLSLFMFALGVAFLWNARRKYLAERSTGTLMRPALPLPDQ